MGPKLWFFIFYIIFFFLIPILLRYIGLHELILMDPVSVGLRSLETVGCCLV